jgi:hypothetical protein
MCAGCDLVFLLHINPHPARFSMMCAELLRFSRRVSGKIAWLLADRFGSYDVPLSLAPRITRDKTGTPDKYLSGVSGRVRFRGSERTSHHESTEKCFSVFNFAFCCHLPSHRGFFTNHPQQQAGFDPSLQGSIGGPLYELLKFVQRLKTKASVMARTVG